MSERTFETGGEILRVGSTVVVFDGNKVRRLKVTEIGTKRVFIESATGNRPVPYSKEDRKSQQGAYGYYFKTETEVAAIQRRELTRSRLRDLGIEARLGAPGHDGFSVYTTETLEQVAVLLEGAVVNKAQSQ
jgi:hypothetical protein